MEVFMPYLLIVLYAIALSALLWMILWLVRLPRRLRDMETRIKQLERKDEM